MVGAAKKRAAARRGPQRAAPQEHQDPSASGVDPESSVSEISTAIESVDLGSPRSPVVSTTHSTGATDAIPAASSTLVPYDGNRDPEEPTVGDSIEINRNLDMPVTVWAHTTNTPIQIQSRPAPCKLGREITIGLNTFNVEQIPKVPVYQYDVNMGSAEGKKLLIQKLWASKAVKAALPNSHRWIFDGGKIAYSVEQAARETRVRVNLDEEEGRTPHPDKADKNVFTVIVRPARNNATIRFDLLNAYLQGQADFSTGCLEAINFLDHLLRETPTKKLVAIKRNFFSVQTGHGFDLGGGAEAFKGTYASIRIGHSPTGKHVLTVNVDVANGTFWALGSFMQLLAAALNCRENDLSTRLRDLRARRDMKKKFSHIRLHTSHRQSEPYCFKEFLSQTPGQMKIPKTDTTVKQYFKTKYNLNVRDDLPLVQMTKPGITVPLELLTIAPNSKVNNKLDDRQTANMIKFAVTPPPERWNDISAGVRALNWPADPYLKGYDLKINTSNAQTKARVLANPTVKFAGTKDVNPGVSGRWRIDGQKFLMTNKVPLKSWGVCVLPGRSGRGSLDKPSVDRFVDAFVKTYVGHGGKVDNRSPVIFAASNPDLVKAVDEFYTAVANKVKTPQILVFILNDKEISTYGRIKKLCECRYGVMSQCMQSSHVAKAQGQYMSNVCMKFNAKLGGITARAVGPQSKGEKGIFGNQNVMITAADVTHPPPASQGNDEAKYSVAAIVNSQDLLATRYTARVDSNGFRQEIIQPKNFEKLWKPQLQSWVSGAGQGRFPSTIIYFRDGVSEGQFAAVIRQEVADMKRILNEVNPASTTKFIVILATKRHHIRFFPKPHDAQSGDKNGNALPGTLVDSCVTHPYENDFFLCSHVALKGTARPTHYHVLLNEAGMSNDQLQTMIYEHCYQFMRATTPVSLFPAVYYADICALRGRYHDAKFGHTGNQAPSTAGHSTDPSIPIDIPDLLPFGDKGFTPIADGMWFI